jgi:hypothetical protein
MKDPVALKRAETERKWRAELNRLGFDVVHERFITRMPAIDFMPYPDAAFLERWIAGKKRAARFRTVFWGTISIIAMIAACIAAWPTVKGWIG